MFTGFTPAAGEFLWELKFHNERPWFLAHKEQFEREVQTPLRELAKAVQQEFTRRCPRRPWCVHVSRIYRDARRLFGRGPYKERMWFTLEEDGEREKPGFWLEIGPTGYSFGMGLWLPSAGCMAYYRRAIEANPARFGALVREFNRHTEYRLRGEEYKRPKKDMGELLNPWYNRKQVYMECCRDWDDKSASADFPAYLAEEFGKLMGLYEFFAEICLRLSAEER